MSDQRIIYVMHPFDVPFGGVANIYRHVEVLQRHGMPAFVALPSLPVRDFYGSAAPILLHSGKLRDCVGEGDVLVIPEGFANVASELAGTPARRLMFCQNQHYLPFSPDPRRGFAEFRVDGVIASSRAIADFFREVYGMADVPVLPYAIDPTRFKAAARKKRQIAYMPRKLRGEVAFMMATFKRRHQRHAEIPWIDIDNVSQAELADLLGESAVFLSLSHRESFGLPPLEAMACGCLVAGFDGGGGREYATSDNGWWAERGDWKGAIDGLAAAFDLLDGGGPDLLARQQAADATVRRYSPARLELELLAFWTTELQVVRGASNLQHRPETASRFD